MQLVCNKLTEELMCSARLALLLNQKKTFPSRDFSNQKFDMRSALVSLSLCLTPVMRSTHSGFFAWSTNYHAFFGLINGKRWTQDSKHSEMVAVLTTGMALQVLQQFCGINTVMYYTPTILQMAGYVDRRQALLVSLLPALVNSLGTGLKWTVYAVIPSLNTLAATMSWGLLDLHRTRMFFMFVTVSRVFCLIGFFSCLITGTIIGMWCVERVGRRKLLLSSMMAVAVSLVLLGQAFSWQNSQQNVIHTSPVVPGSICSTAENCQTCLKVRPKVMIHRSWLWCSKIGLILLATIQ